MASLVLLIFIALLLPGVVNRTRALLSGRRGVSLWQHARGLRVLMRKGAVYSSVTGPVFRLAPVVCFGSALTALLLVPVGGFGPLLSFDGDVVLFCYLLALGRMLLVLAAMDTGSSFEGMGASREALYGALVEPALFTVLGTLALVSGNTSFAGIFVRLQGGSTAATILMALVAYALWKIILVEGGRIPVDDPRTHLELTMIHEAMVLDYCGFDLGLITLAGWLKTASLAAIAAAALSSPLGWGAGGTVLLCVLFGVAIGAIESFMARGRLAGNTTYIVTIFAVALVTFIVGYLIRQGFQIG